MKISLLADYPAEAAKIAKWYYDEWVRVTPNVTEEMVLEKVMEKSINRNTIPMALVVHINGVLVGVLELKIRENKDYPQYEHWVGGVFTHPCYRGQGIASALMTRAKELAVRMGVKTLYLQCESDTIPLYLKHGFKVLHQVQHDQHHAIETTIMEWEVAT